MGITPSEPVFFSRAEPQSFTEFFYYSPLRLTLRPLCFCASVSASVSEQGLQALAEQVGFCCAFLILNKGSKDKGTDEGVGEGEDEDGEDDGDRVEAGGREGEGG